MIALGYDPRRASAPQVVAKGAGHVGKKILQLAREHGIPLHQDPELTRLLDELELDDEIPEQL